MIDLLFVSGHAIILFSVLVNYNTAKVQLFSLLSRKKGDFFEIFPIALFSLILQPK